MTSFCMDWVFELSSLIVDLIVLSVPYRINSKEVWWRSVYILTLHWIQRPYFLQKQIDDKHLLVRTCGSISAKIKLIILIVLSLCVQFVLEKLSHETEEIFISGTVFVDGYLILRYILCRLVSITVKQKLYKLRGQKHKSISETLRRNDMFPFVAFCWCISVSLIIMFVRERIISQMDFTNFFEWYEFRHGVVLLGISLTLKFRTGPSKDLSSYNFHEKMHHYLHVFGIVIVIVIGIFYNFDTFDEFSVFRIYKLVQVVPYIISFEMLDNRQNKTCRNSHKVELDADRAERRVLHEFKLVRHVVDLIVV